MEQNRSTGFIGVFSLKRWIHAVKTAGDRTLAAADRLVQIDMNSSNVEALSEVSEALTTEIFFFVIATHNYAKAFDRTKKFIPEAPLLPFDHRTVRQLRNIKEHWENFEGKIFEHQIINKKALKSLRHFLNIHPDSPQMPHTFSVRPGPECTIADFLDVRKTQYHAIEINRLIEQGLFNL